MDKFIARVRLHADRRGTPVRSQYLEPLAKRIIGELLGSRKPTADELDAIDQTALADKFVEITEAHSNLLAPTKESAFSRLDRANKALAAKPVPERQGAAPRKMNLSDRDRAALEKMSPEHRLDFSHGCLLAREFRGAKE